MLRRHLQLVRPMHQELGSRVRRVENEFEAGPVVAPMWEGIAGLISSVKSHEHVMLVGTARTMPPINSLSCQPIAGIGWRSASVVTMTAST